MAADRRRGHGTVGSSLRDRLQRLTPRRRGLGLTVAALTAAVLALPMTEQGPTAWLAVGIAVVVFSLDRRVGPVTRVLDRAGGIVIAAIILLLVQGTGGADSVFQDLYVLVLVYAALSRSWSRLAVDTLVVVAAGTAPAWFASVSARFWEDLAIDAGVWLAVALLTGVITRHLRSAAADAQRLRSVLDRAHDSVMVLDADSHETLYANDRTATSLGVAVTDLMGRPPYVVTDVSSPETIADQVDQARATGLVQERMYELPHPDGPRLYETLSRVVTTDDGVEALVFVGRDVTAREARHALEHHLAAIVDASDTAILSTDLRGTVQTWNPAAERLYGWTAEEAVGRHVVGLLSPEGQATGDHAQVVAGSHQQFETRHHRRDGSVVDVAVTVSPIRDDRGGLAGVALLSRDVSERKRHEQELAEREDRFRTLAEQAQGIVYRVRLDPDVALEYVNPRVEEVTGHPPERIREDPGLLLQRLRTRAEHPEVTGTDREDAPGTTTSPLQRADGTRIWLEDHHRPQFDDRGRVVATQGIMFDVTSRRQGERARAAALAHQRRAAAALRRTVEIQHTFLQAVSHELRTPLTSVLGFARTLETHGDGMEPRQRRDLVARLSRNAERLAVLLDDLLDLDRLARGALELHRSEVDLGALCEQVVDRLDTHGHDVRVDVRPVVVAVDRPKIERAIDNLLRNAVKHTPVDTHVAVTTEQRDGHAIVCVADDGAGVPDDVVESIFEPFQQGPQAASDASPGTGVGLALVREFARMHDGEAWYEPGDPVGARFYLRLPLDSDSPSASPTPGGDRTNGEDHDGRR